MVSTPDEDDTRRSTLVLGSRSSTSPVGRTTQTHDRAGDRWTGCDSVGEVILSSAPACRFLHHLCCRITYTATAPSLEIETSRGVFLPLRQWFQFPSSQDSCRVSGALQVRIGELEARPAVGFHRYARNSYRTTPESPQGHPGYGGAPQRPPLRSGIPSPDFCCRVTLTFRHGSSARANQGAIPCTFV